MIMHKTFVYKEGQTPFNFLVRWNHNFGFYLYLLGIRLFWFNKAK